MRYCSACGGELTRRVPPGEDRERFICTACQMVHYQNPRVVVGTLVEHEDRILLCRRAIEPRHGYWTLPAGFLELGESTAQGAQRETYEEACARVDLIAPFAHFDIPHIGQSYVFYRARMSPPAFAPGPESLEVALFDYADIPWSELAFDVVRLSLELHRQDRAQGIFRLHHGWLRRLPEAGTPGPGSCVLEEHLAVPLGASPPADEPR